jgi:hypothetical protein
VRPSDEPELDRAPRGRRIAEDGAGPGGVRPC